MPGAAAAVRRARGGDPREEEHEQREADDAQLRRGLELERVRVVDALGRVALLAPDRLVAAGGAAADRGVVREAAERRLPVGEAAAADRAEALRGGAERGIGLLVAGVDGGRCEREDGERRGHGERHRRRAGWEEAGAGRVPVLGARAPGLERGGAGHGGEQRDEEDRALRLAPVALGGLDGGEQRRDARAHRAGLERDRGGAQLRPRRGEREQHGEADAERERAAREAEVDAEPERRRRRRRGDAQRERPGAVAGEPRAEDEPERGERTGRVPVGEGLVEPAAGAARAVQLDEPGEDAAGEPVADHHDDPGGERRLDRPRRRARAERRIRGAERAEVDPREVERVGGRSAERRPRGRDRGPEGEQREAAERRGGGAGEGARSRPLRRHHGHREQRPRDRSRREPRTREVPAAEEREDGRSGEQAGAGDGEGGRAHRRAETSAGSGRRDAH